MKVDIGVFSRKEPLNIELLINDIDTEVDVINKEPTATVSFIGASMVKSMASVKLNKVESSSLTYQNTLNLTEEWYYGKYEISIKYQKNEIDIEEIQTFEISNEMDFTQEKEDYFNNLLNGVENDNYIPMSLEQESSEIIAGGNEIQIILDDTAKYNHTYKVIIDGIKSANGQVITRQIVLDLDAVYKPLYASPNEIKSLIPELFKYFLPREVFIAIRNSSQKALVYLGKPADPNSNKFKEYSERNTQYFPMTKYVAYDAAQTLVQELVAKFLNNTMPDVNKPLEESSNDLGSGFTLGDFSVQNAGELKKQDILFLSSEEFFRKINPILRQLKADITYWLDSMMLRTKRGYANPASGSYRTDAGSPESREV